jgi:LmbE family N-acetylglucosaminyl deacetylase
MKLVMPTAEIFVPDGKPVDEALARTTHMAICAHQDDIEICSTHGVLQCFGLEDKWFTGVIITNGAGSPRDDLYANYSDEDMQKVRKLEQKKAAFVGEYAAQGLLDFTSAMVKEPGNKQVIGDIKSLLLAARPEIVYTHNFADKHDTHVAVALKVIQAIRELPADARPKAVWAGEVWRCLDWMIDDDKVVLDCTAHENISAALLGVFDSQICGGKRYDLAVMGRRKGNATFFASHGVDDYASQNYAMDLTPLIKDDSLDIEEFVNDFILRFSDEVSARISKLSQ